MVSDCQLSVTNEFPQLMSYNILSRLQCAKGIIKITEAFYGRKDNTNCTKNIDGQQVSMELPVRKDGTRCPENMYRVQDGTQCMECSATKFRGIIEKA